MYRAVQKSQGARHSSATTVHVPIVEIPYCPLRVKMPYCTALTLVCQAICIILAVRLLQSFLEAQNYLLHV